MLRDAKYDTRLRAIKQISDETAADVEGMVAEGLRCATLRVDSAPGYGSRRLVTVRSPRNDFQRVPILTPKPYNWVLPWIFLIFCRSLWLPWRWPSHR